MHLAAQEGHIECVTQLLSYASINVNAQDDDCWTPLHIAALNGHSDCVELLLSHKNIYVNIQDTNGNTPLKVAQNSCNNYINKETNTRTLQTT